MFQRDIKEYEKMANVYFPIVWKAGLPSEVGLYWLYSYRYGKISCGQEMEKELHLLEVQEGGNGLLLKADGQFVFDSELEEPLYMPLTLPELPNKLNTAWGGTK